MTAHRCCLSRMSPAALCVAASRRRLLVDAFNNSWAAFRALGRALPGLSARFALPAKIQLAGWAATGSLAGAAIESLGHRGLWSRPRRPIRASEGPSSRSTHLCAAAPGPMLAACRTPRRLAGDASWFVETPQATASTAQANVSGCPARRHARASRPTRGSILAFLASSMLAVLPDRVCVRGQLREGT